MNTINDLKISIFFRMLEDHICDSDDESLNRFIRKYRRGTLDFDNLCDDTRDLVLVSTEDEYILEAMYDLLNTQAHLVASCLNIVSKGMNLENVKITSEQIMSVLTDEKVYSVK